MALALQICSYLVGIPLELLAIAAILRSGGYRRFPLVFAWVIGDFLTTAVEMPSNLAYLYTKRVDAQHWLVNYYWVDEAIMQILVFAVVIGLIFMATTDLPQRRLLRAALIAFAVLFAGVSFLIHFDRQLNMGAWLTPWNRDLNVCSAILDLALWALLLTSKKKDHRLLLLSGALGIQFTGQAIGASLRQLAIAARSRPLVNLGNTVVVLTYLLLLYIWWQAFRTPRELPSVERRADG